ncbi:MAG: peptidoglycan DD-metalloendopeptidase family protein [Rhizobiales bacterium]|nr:peptidoglycan DD-metalloendopeptidase family protein [Hyphomicrobiales bacterium]
MKLRLVSAFVLAVLGAAQTQAYAQGLKPPTLSFAQADWGAALAALPNVDALGPTAMAMRTRTAQVGPGGPIAPALTRLNGAMAPRMVGIASSPVPVLLPFDVETLLRDQANGTADDSNERYLGGFHAAQFFYAGPAGYDAAFAIRTTQVPELSDISFSRPIEVQISGSSVLYELDTPITMTGDPVPALENEFPGIRRLRLERYLRYTFVRFGVPYVASVLCFDSGVSREGLPTCRAADRVLLRFLRALRVAGGMPNGLRPAKPLPVERPAAVSNTFGYFAPGLILSGSGSRKRVGRADHTVYSQIRFPLADAAAHAGSEMFPLDQHGPGPVSADGTARIVYPWRDNFCERRSFAVAQCPAGHGHQGQDIRPMQCTRLPGTDRCERYGEVLAVRGGIIMRSPKQEAAYLIVNSANEHIRFRYLHMSPRKMDADGLLSGRRVHEGEVIGEVSNYSMQEAGTSYHLHFDIQVPTKDGWVFVNPYMTLVASYERLIGAHGTELADPTAMNSAVTDWGSSAAEAAREQPKRRTSKVRKPARRNDKR